VRIALGGAIVRGGPQHLLGPIPVFFRETLAPASVFPERVREPRYFLVRWLARLDCGFFGLFDGSVHSIVYPQSFIARGC
jgi:hypothetical protein